MVQTSKIIKQPSNIFDFHPSFETSITKIKETFKIGLLILEKWPLMASKCCQNPQRTLNYWSSHHYTSFSHFWAKSSFRFLWNWVVLSSVSDPDPVGSVSLARIRIRIRVPKKIVIRIRIRIKIIWIRNTGFEA